MLWEKRSSNDIIYDRTYRYLIDSINPKHPYRGADQLVFPKCHLATIKGVSELLHVIISRYTLFSDISFQLGLVVFYQFR